MIARPHFPVTAPAKQAMWAAAAFGIWQGTNLIAGGPERFGSPGVAMLRILPHWPYSWGIWALSAGLILAAGKILHLFRPDSPSIWPLKAVGLGALSLWSGAFGAGAIVSAYASPTPSLTGGPTYFLIAFLLAGLIAYDDRESDGTA